MTHQPDDFDQIVSHGGFGPNPPAAYIDSSPYGPAPTMKTGLTPRGRAGIAVITAVIAGGSLLGWQHYSAGQAANEARAQEYAIQQQQIELEKLKELNKAAAAAEKNEAAENSERNKLIDACVDSNKKMVGKMLGVTYQSVRDDCEAQYPAISTSSMQAASSATDTTNSGGGGINNFVLVGGGVIATGLILLAKKSSNRTPEYPPPYRPY